jgi:hypothetical protein
MVVPAWLALTCAAMVIVWGVYRVKVSLRSAEQEKRAARMKGLYAMPRRTHLLVGVIYILLGVGLAGIGLGWRPFQWVIGGDETTQPAPSNGVQIEMH